MISQELIYFTLRKDTDILMADRFKDKMTAPVQNVMVRYLFESDFYNIKNWVYDFSDCKDSSDGFNDCFCIVFVKRGNFLFDLSRETHDLYSGHIVIDKPNYEYRLRPAAGECSIFNFNEDFYRQFQEDLNLEHSFFFSNRNILSLMLRTTPEIEYLHFQIMSKVVIAGKLEMDNLVLELLKQIITTVSENTFDQELNDSLRANHLRTIESAKNYLYENFASDISLKELSGFCCVSPFHFSRIFKKFTSYSPHQYLLNIRLKHGEMLLKNSTLSISEISYSCGFNSVEYFATAFKQKYSYNPTQYRLENKDYS